MALSLCSCFASCTAILSMNEVPFGVNTRPLRPFFSTCFMRPDFSSCWRIVRMCDPDALYMRPGLWPLFFLPPYLVLSFSVPMGPSFATDRRMAADLMYHQSS